MHSVPRGKKRETISSNARVLIPSCWRSHAILLPAYLGQFTLSHAGIVITGMALSTGELRELWLVYLMVN